MKKMFVFAAMLALAGMLVRAQEVPPPEGAEGEPPAPPEAHATEHRGGPGGEHRRGPEGMHRQQLVHLREEAAELKAMYDENQDGVLDEAERIKLDADLAIAERLEHFVQLSKILKEVDADRNFEISDEEAAQIPAAMEKLRPAGGPGMRRGGPGGRPQGAPGGRRRPGARPGAPGRRPGGPGNEDWGDEARPPRPANPEEAPLPNPPEE